MSKKVFVGMSGGVDSSVAASILKDQGYDVTGVYIKGWYPDFIVCNWRDEMRDAMRICAKLEIPFMLCDAEESYKKYVVDYLIDGYSKGYTPNPDIMCNKFVKFDTFLNFAINEGADFIATGHYAIKKENGDMCSLFESADKQKDQTYFLWSLNQDQLKKILFPIGHLTKDQVRDIAHNKNLHTQNKKDSQGICFLENIELKSFLSHFIKIIPGDVLDESGNKIGQHEGAILYTLGERHGFTIDLKTDRNAYYVTNKNISDNTITVSSNNISKKNDYILSDLNITHTPSDLPSKLGVRYRYRGEICLASIEIIDKSTARIHFNSPNELIAPGQSAVFYINDECIGGGIIAP